MFGWIKKRILKSIIKDITKQLPKYKDMALIYVEQHKDEIIEKVRKAIEDIVKNELAKVLNKWLLSFLSISSMLMMYLCLFGRGGFKID